MANNINCTCGHSWSKASSSKKDMYVCHICGKDNTMKDGGWLDNYGKKPNPNDVQASVGPDFIGLGYDITGRNYSPAWGGQFEDGGNIAQKGKSIPVPTTADSARLFNAQTALNNFYAKEMKAGRLNLKGTNHLLASYPGDLSGTLQQLNKDNLNFYRTKIAERSKDKSGIDDEYYKNLFNLSPEKVRDLENTGLAMIKSGSEYQQYYRDLITPMQNLASPFALLDSRIAPQRQIRYKPKSYDYPGGDVMVYDYDPLAIKPYHMRTDKEKIEWEKKYGKGTPITSSTKKPTTSTEKSKTAPEKKKTPVVKKSEETKQIKPTKSEETKPTPYTPKGSKKYIVNGIEVSEEDFLGSGPATGGSKRIIYSTPKLGSQKVLRLDGTPETDPEKIRKALATANKKEEFQSGGFLQPISYKLPSRYRIPYAEPSSELAMSIGGEGGEPAYLIPSFKGGKELKDPIAEYKKTGEHLGGPFKTWQEADKWEQEIRHPYVEKGKPIPTPLKRWGDMAMGGSLPGAVGFTYARVAGSAPSNGKYAKKTKASAQNGKAVDSKQIVYDNIPSPASIRTKATAAAKDKIIADMNAVAPIKNTAVNFMQEWMNSPMYKSMLQKSAGKDWSALNASRKANLNTMSSGPGTWKLENLNPDNTFVDDYVYNDRLLGEFYFDKNKLSIDSNLDSDEQKKVGVHELSHATDKAILPAADVNKMQSYRNSFEKTRKGPVLVSDSFYHDYIAEPTETRARLNALRYQGKEQGIYDPFTEKFDKSKLNLFNSRFSKNAGLDQLRQIYTDDQIVDLLNSVSKSQETPSDISKAQNGKEMKFYQEGLDFKPNSIAQDGGAIVDPMGQWAHPGEVTIIPSTDITMEGVDYPVLGISDTGDQQMMYPGEDYQFDGEYVTEYPMMKQGGWLNKYK